MTDPLDALRDASPREAPSPEFAAALRARLEEALGRPSDAVDDILNHAFEEAEETLMTPPITIQQFTPYLSVPDGRRAIAFYTEAFGAEVIDEPTIMPDGKIGHVTLQIGSTRLFLAEEFPEMGLVAPPNLGGVSVTLHVSFATGPEVDVVAERAVAAGATLERPVADGPYGRGGVVVDPSGHRWFLLHEPN
ncbi:VOC family protein [Cryptosporangium aurantiacum]|uniref:Uncharacterized conserved protein PhnB, glyoxalase superfamily n=1 Tax=Cryptosporangium aurantiacum TaxID=134849 RepID=A0A1M7N827_9ACTN|nr:VOC family protein [Cryptosporangium aurantiacum]SHM99226.1 Uncharacterized conserved protein PhnB, glyoxalase superfamily [Cryptosporangium aurantiacum]